ncbi:efflux RND transporter periplasmic adaptor subunit [Pendulispora albinea]|uniref:Efflux RND transporter periplasmic adaptor subunit n=1 Tax=Pendulispora albinea TaxID=2741071 RepID=A0ABZ2M230_9BACT
MLGLILVIGILGGVKGWQISNLMAMGKEAAKQGPPPESVGTAVASEQTWEGTLSAVGSVTSLKGVALSNDAPGVVTRISFESGQVVRQGQVLVELDVNVERTQLASAEARKELAMTNVTRTRALVEKGAIAQSQLDTDDAQLKTATADVENIKAQIARKQIRAPFSGRLGIRNVNLGQYLSPGTSLTVLEAINAVYVDFTLPQQRLSDITVGMPVRLESTEDAGAPREGTVAAVDPSIDTATRAIKVRASVPNKDEKLRPGMFVNVSVVLPTRASTVTVPLPAVVHAPYGDSVFVAEDKKADAPGGTKTPDGRPIKTARQQFVRVGEARGDFVEILDGIKAGQEVVTSGAFKLRNGAPITIDNKVQPKPQLNPAVENK